MDPSMTSSGWPFQCEWHQAFWENKIWLNLVSPIFHKPSPISREMVCLLNPPKLDVSHVGRRVHNIGKGWPVTARFVTPDSPKESMAEIRSCPPSQKSWMRPLEIARESMPGSRHHDWNDWNYGHNSRLGCQIDKLDHYELCFFLGPTNYAPDLWNEKLLS